MAVVDAVVPNQMIRVEDAMAFVTTPLDHARVHRGDLWVCSAISPSTADGSFYLIHLRTHADAAETHLTFDSTGSGASYVRLYEAPTTSANGTALTLVNRMRITARQQALKLLAYHTPTVTDNGTLLMARYMGAGQKSGGSVREEEWVLKPDTKYLISMESDAAGNLMTCNFMVYEK